MDQKKLEAASEAFLEKVFMDGAASRQGHIDELVADLLRTRAKLTAHQIAETALLERATPSAREATTFVLQTALLNLPDGLSEIERNELKASLENRLEALARPPIAHEQPGPAH